MALSKHTLASIICFITLSCCYKVKCDTDIFLKNLYLFRTFGVKTIDPPKPGPLSRHPPLLGWRHSVGGGGADDTADTEDTAVVTGSNFTYNSSDTSGCSSTATAREPRIREQEAVLQTVLAGSKEANVVILF